MLSGSREMQVSGRVKEDTVTVPKIAAVERREARVPGNNGTRHLHQVPVRYRSAFPALRSLAHAREKEMQASPLRLPNSGADGARLYAGDAPPRCLKCESASAQGLSVIRRNRASATVAGQ